MHKVLYCVLWVTYWLKMDTCYTLHINMRRCRAARVALLPRVRLSPFTCVVYYNMYLHSIECIIQWRPVTCVLPTSPCHHLDVKAPITQTHSLAALASQVITEIMDFKIYQVNIF